VLVAASAIGVSVVIRGLHPKNVVTTHPSPTPIATPTPLSQQLRVPAGTPVILFHDPVNFNQIDGITWDGSVEGRLGVYPEAGQGILPNPDGTLWATTHDVRNRSGAIVATLAGNTKGFPGTWADDGQHYCSMASESPFGQPGGKPTTLQVTAVGQAPRNVVQVGVVYEQTSVSVAACSIEKDRAVVVQSGGQGMSTAQLWVVQVSTGRIIWTRSYPLDGSTLIDILSSRDGQFVAEVRYIHPAAEAGTTIYGPSGAVAGHFSSRVDGFSWDGALAVLGDYGGPVSVVRWRDGTVVWSGPSGWAVMPEPGGQRVAIWVRNPDHPQTGGFPPVDLYVVGPDGQAKKLLTNVM
jgi:hypothetical protein